MNNFRSRCDGVLLMFVTTQSFDWVNTSVNKQFQFDY